MGSGLRLSAFQSSVSSQFPIRSGADSIETMVH